MTSSSAANGITASENASSPMWYTSQWLTLVTE